jgi:HEAT repeat protein
METVLAAVLTAWGCTMVAAADKPVVDPAAVDKAFEALKTLDWGMDLKPLAAIDDAIPATYGDAAARKELATRLAAVLGTGAPRAAKDYVCRKLRVIGSAESVPALAALLTDKDLSHMARYALERIPAPEAAQAMRDALPKLSGALKIGAVGSLGVRRDAASVAAIAPLLGDADPSLACAAACALGNIGTPEAATALLDAGKKAPEATKPAIADGALACAERLVADGQKAEAIAVYKSLKDDEAQSKQVRLAATRGLLSAAGK